MKKNLSILLLAFICQHLTAQGIHVKATLPDKNGKPAIVDIQYGKSLVTTSGSSSLMTFNINCADLPMGDKLTITAAGQSFNYKVKDTDQALTFSKNILSSDIIIKHLNKVLKEIPSDEIKFQIVAAATAVPVQSVHESINITDEDGNLTDIDILNGKDLTVAKDAPELYNLKIASKDLPDGDKL